MSRWQQWGMMLVILAGSSAPLAAGIQEINYHQSQLLALYPQEAGDEREGITVDYIRTFLEREEIRYKIEDLSQKSDRLSFSKNVYIPIAGESPERLIIAITLNNSSINVAIGLELIRHWHLNPPPVELLFVFLGDEAENEQYRGNGAVVLFSDSRRTKGIALIHLNIAESRQYFSLDIGGREQLTPAWMLSDIRQSLIESALQLYQPPLYAAIIRNQRFTPLRERKQISLPIVAMRQAIPAFSVVSREANPLLGGQNRLISPEEYSNLMFALVDGIASREDRPWEGNYIILPSFFNIIVVGEPILLIFLLTFFAITAAGLGYQARTTRARYVRLVKHYWWDIPLILITLYLSLVGANWLLLAIDLLHAVDNIWGYHPFLFVLSMIILADILFLLLQKAIISKSPIPIGRYYSIAALLSAILGLLIISSITLAYSVIILWVAFCTLIFLLTPLRIGKIVACAASLGLPIVFLLVLFFQTEYQFGISSLHTPFFISIPVALTITPIYFMILRLRRIRRSQPVWYLRLVIPGILLIGSIGYILTVSPFDSDNPQPIMVEERLGFPSSQHSLIIHSPARLRNVDLLYGDQRIQLYGTQIQEYLTHNGEFPIKVSHELQRGANSTLHSFRIESSHVISWVTVRIHSRLPLRISESIYPFRSMENGRIHTVQIGQQPPLPLFIEFYTDRAIPLTAEFEIGLKEPLASINIVPREVNGPLHPFLLVTDSRATIMYNVEL